MVGVAVRIRPGAQVTGAFAVGERVVRVQTPDVQREFAFDRVYDCDAAQDDVNDFVTDLVTRCLRGQVTTLLCYGQTGSGKTHTMGLLPILGHQSTDGIVPYCLRKILKTPGNPDGSKPARVRLEFIEQYLDSVHDLLNMDAKLNLRDMGKHGVVVENSTHVEVQTYEEALEIITLALQHRQVLEVSLDQGIIADPTSRQHLSSRAHAILTIHVEVCPKTQLWGRLVLVDLAGSERASSSTGPRLMEARHINSSLSALGSLVYALAMHKKHRPWRDTKLTKLLWDSLYRGHVRLLATIHADAEFSTETLSTLAFASRCKRLTVPTSPVQSPVRKATGLDAAQNGGDVRHDSDNSHTAQYHVGMEDATIWFTQVLATIANECEGASTTPENKDRWAALPHAPLACTHMLPIAQQCVGKIKYLKNVANLHKTMSDKLVSHAAARLSGVEPEAMHGSLR
eukprot:GEMP01037807.1.p1 GENE.GEMP01037807.1~~GEMP01037807.1.p1  ORF type:complete len:456 (+),score=104.08 GEMP01037807.1:105-1472(+)